MGFDLGIKSNEVRFERALQKCNSHAESNLCTFDQYELDFLSTMNKHWRIDGFKFQPSVKQWNMLMGMAQETQ